METKAPDKVQVHFQQTTYILLNEYKHLKEIKHILFQLNIPAHVSVEGKEVVLNQLMYFDKPILTVYSNSTKERFETLKRIGECLTFDLKVQLKLFWNNHSTEEIKEFKD